MDTQNSSNKIDVATVFGLFAEFLVENKSVSIVLGSTIVTAFMADFSFASLIVHGVNLGVLIGVREFAKSLRQRFVPAFMLLLVSVGLTALMSKPTTVSFIIQVINVIALLFMCFYASNEHKTTAADVSGVVR